MLVRLDFEDDRQPVADVDRARVLARSLKNVPAFRRQLAQQRLRRLVGTVLAPKRPEDADLQVVRISPDRLHDRAVLVLIEGDRLQLRAIDRDRHHTATLASAWMAERKMTSPSSPPSNASQARSGCGIRPTTLPRAFEMPAMFRSEPLGFESAVTRPSGEQ